MNLSLRASFIEKYEHFIKQEKTRFITACASVFILGLIAHAYGFLNLTISHDSLYEFYLSESDILHKIGLGRFMGPIYQFIFHGRISLPWLNGLLALFWLSVSVWMTAYMFSITDKLRIALIAGIFSINITVTALTATYIHDLDADMFAIMLAVGMVFLWHQEEKTVWFGVPLLVLVLGLYQSMISVAISLIMISSILALLQGKKAADVIRKGLQAVCIIFIAGIVYMLAVKLSCHFAKIDLSSEYNGLTNIYNRSWELKHHIKLLWWTYSYWSKIFLCSSRSVYEMFLLHIPLVISAIAAIIYAMRIKSLLVSNKILVLAIGTLLPLGMNFSLLLSNGMGHHLMLYAAWLMYLLIILMTDWFASTSVTSKIFPQTCRVITVVFLVLIFVTHVQTANCAYVKRDLERQATLAFMAAVNRDMNKQQGYVAGKTEIVFIGDVPTVFPEAFDNIRHITGMEAGSPITYTHEAYFKYILQTPLRLSKNKVPEKFTNLMKAYPKNGCMQWYGNILVIKLSDESIERNITL